ncbi:MAG: glycerol-3-phosphate 1-O-acyltransferase PlsY [Dehalococcoidales bacterium]|nr:glycerol-3-phosphate 1-O-acyltransferase PlsY [Dehalococcoidales bacterium]
MIVGLYAAAIILGYLIGSIPFGLILARMTVKTDIREVGSGKIGTTNVMRVAGRKVAAVALVLDLAKGALTVVFAGLILGDNYPYMAQGLAGMAAIIGHTWSVFLGFKGGRGVATFIGGLLAMYWPAGTIGAIFIIGIGFRSRYMSLGSITGAVTAFVYMMAVNILRIEFLEPHPPIEFVIYAMFGAIFIYVMHRDNIIRLVNGTERKIGEKATPRPTPSSTAYK